jgi:hypothetical protein
VLGVFDWRVSVDDRPLRGPFVPDGWWAILADLCCAMIVIGVSAVVIAESMKAVLRLPVSRFVVGVVVLLTGVAPFLYLKLLPVTGPASLLAATFLIRRFAIDRTIPIRPRIPRGVLYVRCALAVVGLGVIVSFGVAHPLWPNSVNVNNRQVAFMLRNAGFAKITVVGMSADAFAGSVPWEERRPVKGLIVPARGSRWVTLRQRGCPPRDLTVRYRIFGRVVSAPLRPIPPPLELRC